jgi:hypothetical protein
VKLFLSAIFILIYIHLFSQDLACPKFKNPINSKRAIGANFSENYCSRFLFSSDINNLVVDELNRIEIPDFGFNTGLTFLYTFNDKINFESGIQYNTIGERTKKMIIDSIRWPDNIPDPKYDDLQSIRFKYQYQYFEIPMKIDFLFNKAKRGKFDFFGSLGFIPMFYYQSISKGYYYFSDRMEVKSNVIQYDFFNIFSLSISLSAGIDYNFLNRFVFRIEPNIRSQIISISNAPVWGYYYSGGLNLGLLYKL